MSGAVGSPLITRRCTASWAFPFGCGIEPSGTSISPTTRGAAKFSLDDQRLVERFALHAAIAIDNARMHEQVRRLAVVEERDRIGRDLHDGVIQRLYAVTLALDDVPELMDESPADARDRVERSIEALQSAIGDIRTFIYDLAADSSRQATCMPRSSTWLASWSEARPPPSASKSRGIPCCRRPSPAS